MCLNLGDAHLPSTIGSNLRRLPAAAKLELACVIALCVAVFAGAAWISSSVFDRVPHTEDESAFLFQARTIASGHVVAGAPEEPRFFSIPFIILREGMWFGKYPPGFPLVLSTGVLAGHPWLVNASLAALCVALVYGVARRLYGQATALLAAVLLSVSPFFLLQSGSLLSHLASLFWTLLFLALFPVARLQCGAALPIAAGAAVGMMFLSRPLSAVGIAVPFILWTLLTVVKQRKFGRAYLMMAAGALPFLVIFLAYNFYTTGSPLHTAYELWWDFDRLGFGPDVGINGHDLDDGIRNTRVNSNALATLLFGWPGRLSMAPASIAVILSIVALLGRVYRERKPTRTTVQTDGPSPEAWDLILASMVLSLAAIHILYWTPGQMYGPRYYMEAVGPLVILSARGLWRIRDILAAALMRAAPGAPRPVTLGTVATLSIVALLTAYSFARTVPEEFERFRDWNDINRDGVAIVEAAELDNALVFVARDSWTDYAPFFAQNVPSLDSEVVYASDRGMENNEALMRLYPDREYYHYQGGRLSSIEAGN